MTDREKLVELLLKCEQVHERDLNDDWKDGEIEAIADHLIANGVTIAEMQKPLSLERVKENRAVWIEDDGCETGQELYPALYYAKGHPHHTVFIYQEEDHAWLDNLEYGVTWRCWATKPTEEEMANAEWEEGATDGD